MNNKEDKKNVKKDFKYYLKEYGPFVITIIIVLLFKHYFYSPIMVSGVSMETTLLNNDIMILDKVALRNDGIQRFDIVVIRYKNKYLIKRVIGLPGEEVEIKDNKLYINGEYIEEPFLNKGTVTKDFKLEGTVPEDFYFVMGDNRSNSNDSRYLGCFSIDRIDGKTSLTIFPFNRVGKKK